VKRPQYVLTPICVLVIACLPAAARSSQPTAPPPAAAPVTERFLDRLERLTPADPISYFRLGEEVADAAADPASMALARELLVLAFHLDLAAGGQAGVAAPACLALAEAQRGGRDRAWLLALAKTLDPRRVAPEWLTRPVAPTADSAAYQVAMFLGLVRSGDGAQARQLLARPGVREGLYAYNRVLRELGLPGGAEALEREAGRWPCPECAGARIVRRPGPGGGEVRLCSNCRGDPGPRLAPGELEAHLRFESWALQGVQRSWAAQAAVDAGAPLLDPDPASVAPAFGVDPSRTLWRNGAWTSPQPAAPSPPQGDPAPPASAAPAIPPSGSG